MHCTILLLVALFTLSHALSYDPTPEIRPLGLEGMLRMRCSLCDTQETFYFFNGSVIAYIIPQDGVTQSNTVLFKTVGGNVGRCFKRVGGGYTLASREFLYYIDPATDQIVNSWTNPWTGDTVTVMHVDNDPVLQQYANTSTSNVMVIGDETVMFVDVPLLYPNPLFSNPAFAPYSPQRSYQAGEFFKFVSPTADVFNSDLDTVSYSFVSWTRTGPWLPWMKMGNISGNLIYTSQGNRVSNWTAFPVGVRNDLQNRVPQYQSAPSCVPNASSVTSWTFFARNFDNYIAGAQFPLATPASYNCVPNPQQQNACRAEPKLSVCSGASTLYSGLWIAITSIVFFYLMRK